MAGRRSCVNSLWSGAERVRIGERLKATLAGVLELELLRCKQLDMVDGALDRRETPAEGGSTEDETGHSAATSRRQQVVCSSETIVSPCQSSPEDNCSSAGDGTLSGRGSDLRWSTLSWDAPSELLSPPTPDPSGTHLESDSRPSSGFYSVSGSSLSDSCYSVSSEAAQGGFTSQTKPPKEQVPILADNSDIVWSDGAAQEPQRVLDAEPVEETTVSGAEVLTELLSSTVPAYNEVTGLNFLSDMCSDFSQALISSLQPILDPTAPTSAPSKDKRHLLDPRFCTDLVSRRTKEVYSYPSPLHAVALQSPLFTCQSQEQSASPSPEEESTNDGPDSHADQRPEPQQSKAVISCTQLEKYIHRLAHQYNSRVHSSSSDLTLPSAVTQRGLCTPGKSHGSTQSLSTVPGGSITPCKSLLGNSARVCLSTSAKKATRNSINLGNLPSATGEDLNINLHLNLNLNLAPGLKSSRELTDNQNNCGTLGSNVAGTTVSTASVPASAPTPALRARPRISTCPSSLSHRSSLEVSSSHGTSPGFGSAAFCRSLDWSTGSSEHGLSVFGANCGSAPGSQRSSLIQESSVSSRLSEDCHMVGEISRLSGLSRAVVVGLMEQGVELDVECFQADTPGEAKPQRKSHLTAQTESSNYSRQTDLSPQRPIQLSLSVTHSPQSQSSTTPPRSHSSSPIHPYQSIQVPSPYYSSHCQYQQISSTSDPPSSTASSPASRPTQRGGSPPRPLQQSPMSATPLTVFRRDAPFQCSLPRTITRTSTMEHGGIQPRGGSLRQSVGGSGRWSRAEGEGLYKGKHASHKLIRAATVSSYGKSEDYSDGWAVERREQMVTPKKSKFCRGFDRNASCKESGSERQDVDRFEYGYGWRRNSGGSWDKDHRQARAASSCQDRKPQAENSPALFKKKGKEEGERRSSSLRLSRRALFRSESQGLLVPQNYTEEPKKRPHWVSSFDVGHGDICTSKHERGRLLRASEEEKRLSSTASLFNLSRSQSLEGSSHSLSPLSSPSFSPSPPPRLPLQRSRSLRDLGRKVFGSMRSLSLKRKPSKK